MAEYKYARVARTVRKEGRELETGEVVDLDEYRWADQLIDQDRLVPLIHADEFVECVCGTTLANQDWFEHHQQYHCEFDLDEMNREELLDIAEDRFGLVEEDIEGTGSDGYVKVADIQDEIVERL